MTISKGFTFWEVLIVIVVIGILAAIALPNYQNYPTSNISGNPIRTGEADDFLKNMLPANIAFNTPKTMEVGKSHSIELFLSLNEPLDLLAERITEEGPVEKAEIEVSNVVEARLTGQHFKILSITQEKQAITTLGITTWKWDIEAESNGLHKLHLTLNTSITINGEKTPRTIRTFDREIDVTVKFADRVQAFISTNWQWLWAAILVPIAGFAWKRRKQGKNA